MQLHFKYKIDFAGNSFLIDGSRKFAKKSRGMDPERPINVLILESIFHLGGAERVTYEICKRTDTTRFKIFLCTLYEMGPMGEVFANDGFEIFEKLMGNKFDIGGFFRLIRLIKKKQIDLIYLINQPLTLFWGFAAAKLSCIPVVPVIHDTVVVNEALKLNLYKLLLPFVERVITVAGLQKDHLVKNEGIPSRVLEVIYNGIDLIDYQFPSDSNSARALLEEGGDEKIVGIVTRLVPLKGIDVFLKAAASVLESNKKIRFIIVGDGPLRSELLSLARSLGINQQVRFMGVRHDIQMILPAFDVAVLSSRTEALPMVVLEYMASGKAIVATHVGSIPELIIDGVTGYLVPPDNPKALADRIDCCLKDQARAGILGQNARRVVEKKYQISATVCQTENLISSLVAKNRGLS